MRRARVSDAIVSWEIHQICRLRKGLCCSQGRNLLVGTDSCYRLLALGDLLAQTLLADAVIRS